MKLSSSLLLLLAFYQFLCSGCFRSTSSGATQDHYRILGVPRDATTAEIKRAFRKQAIKYHPDRTNNDPKAAEKFVKLNEANQVLTDPVERRRYDQVRSTGHRHDSTFHEKFRRAQGFGSRGFQFNGREFRFYANANNKGFYFREQTYHRPSTASILLTEFGIPLLLLLFFILIKLLEAFENVDEERVDQTKKEQRFPSEAPKKQNSVVTSRSRFKYLSSSDLEERGRFIVLALTRELKMPKKERETWRHAYKRLHDIVSTFSNDKCLYFRKVSLRNPDNKEERMEMESNYINWLNCLLADNERLECIVADIANRREQTSMKDQNDLTLGVRLDALCVLRASRKSSAVIVCEETASAYVKRFYEEDVLTAWLSLLLDGSNVSSFKPISQDNWPI